MREENNKKKSLNLWDILGPLDLVKVKASASKVQDFSALPLMPKDTRSNKTGHPDKTGHPGKSSGHPDKTFGHPGFARKARGFSAVTPTPKIRRL